ncbi:MAG: malate synthase A [Anaerolineae bacterium]|nr:malate synthase A [Anaerolineae bacterium]
MTASHPAGVELVHIPTDAPDASTILTPEALAFLADLTRSFRDTRAALLAARVERQARLDAGELPDFLPETAHIRESDWTVGATPADLQDRRVEITGPTDPKMVINALNSGASVFMADFEDATAPAWGNMIEGQVALSKAVRRTLTFTSPEGKHYQLNDKTAVLVVRPRGWHLDEKHVLVDGEPMPGSLFDFGLYFFHNAKAALERGTGPYFYLPKLENHHEAKLWDDVFRRAQDLLGLPVGTIKATVLIETILAAFEADEILYALRDHIVALNCGRWDYIFSVIKKFRAHPDRVLPDRAQITMTAPMMRAYAQYVIKVCHKRGAHAMGGMAAQIPIKNNPEANQAAFDKVRADKLREVTDGHDGTWVAHPGLVPVALDIFNEHMPTPNQVSRQRDDVQVTAADLLAVPTGLRMNLSVGVQYVEAWLNGNGCVPLYNLMEDAATAEISRAQVWQWLKHGAVLDDGQPVTVDLIDRLMAEELLKIRAEVGDDRFEGGRYHQAAELFTGWSKAADCPEFLTTPAYEFLP